MNFMIQLLVLLGVILMMLVIWYFVKKYLDKQAVKNLVKDQYPSPQYMDAIGKYCPDGWIYQDNNSNCSSDNINYNNCYRCLNPKVSNSSQSFSPIDSFPTTPAGVQDLMQKQSDRCDWLQSSKYDWTGISGYCP